MWRPFTSKRTHQRQRTLTHQALTRNPWRPKFESLEERTVPSILFSSTGSRTIVDTGGPILQSMQVDLIFWGAHWNDPGQNQTLRTNVHDTVNAFLNSPYFDGLAQYRGIGHGTLLREDLITTSSPGSTFQTAPNGDLATMVANNINNNTLPSPNGRILYFVIPQPGSTASDCGCIGRHLAGIASGNRVFPYGVTNNPANVAIDTLGMIMSHEMVEAASNPEWNITSGGVSQAAFHVPGSNGDEIGDGEAQNYTYRVHDAFVPQHTALVQAYLSQRDHAYIVTNGSTNNFLVSNTRVLTLTTPFVGNQFFIGLVGNGVAAELNSSTAQFEPGAISAVQVTAPSGTLQIAGTPVPVNVQYNGANARVDLGNSTNGVQDIRGVVNIQNSGGRTTLNVDDSANRNGTTARQHPDGMGHQCILGLAPADIQYRGLQTGAVFIFLGSGPNTFTVENTNTAGLVSDPTTITTGRGNTGNTVNVLATDATTPLNVVGGGPNTTVNVGSSGSLGFIHALVNVMGDPNTTALIVDDSADTSASHSVSLSNTGINVSSASPIVRYSSGALRSLTLEGGPGNPSRDGPNHFDIVNTPTAQTTLRTRGSGDSVQVEADQGPVAVGGFANNSIVVGSSGSLGFIHSPVSVANIGGLSAATLTIDDSADTFADRQVTLTSTAVTISGALLTTINYSAVTSLTYNGGPGTDGFNVFDVEGTAAGTNTTLIGGGVADEFEVSPSGTDPNGLPGPLTIHGRPASSSFLVYFDAFATAAQTYTLTANTISRTGAAPVSFDNLNYLIVATASVGSNTVNVPSVAADAIAAFNPANGDTITIGANQTLAAVQGKVEVNPTDNISANIVIDDSSNATPPAGPISFSNDVTFGFTISGLAPEAISLSARQNTTLNTSLLTGAGDKIFNMQAAPVGVALALDAGSGTNTLDYTGYAGNVLANFQTGEFTGFSSIAHVQNVTGGQGANILVGDGNENLTGGTSQNLIISGGGSGQITGGGAGDILIGGTTAYDMDDASLQAILNYWTASGDDYRTRVTNLRTGNNVPQLEGGLTVFDSGAANTLTGNGNEAAGIFNLFYVTEAGTVTDPQPYEVVVDIDNPAAPAATDQTRTKHGSAEFDPRFVRVPSVAHVNSSIFDQGNDPSSRLGFAKKASWTPWEA